MDRLVLDFRLFGSEAFGGSTRTIGSEGLEVGEIGVWFRTGGGGGVRMGGGGGGATVGVLDW